MVKHVVATGVALLAVACAGTAAAGNIGGPIAPVGGTQPQTLGNAATATLSNPAAGFASALTLRLHGELQCGRLLARTFVVQLPAAMTVPARIAPAAVRLGGVRPAKVAVRARTVTLTLPVHLGAICDSLRPGWYAISFAHTVGLRNPRAAGSYAFSVAGRPGGVWRGTLAVSG